jgi:hypothetical protein
MTKQHTATPWHVGAGNGEGAIFAESGRMRLESGGTTLYPVCTIVRGWDEAEDAANARLIAAAPAMLEALHGLKKCAAITAERLDIDSSAAIWAWISEAQDALMQATGGTDQ